MTGKSSGTNHYFVRSDTNDGTGDKTADGSSYSNTFMILEGTDIKYAWTPKSDGKPDIGKVFKLIYTDENGQEKILYFRIKNKGRMPWDSWGTCNVTLTGVISNVIFPPSADAVKSLTVDGNNTLNIAAV